jgi:hypothetical protein
MASQILLRGLIADATIPAYSLVKFGTDNKHVAVTSAVADKVIGIYSNPVDAAAGDPVDITVIGIDRVRAGAAFSPGDLLTTDASGRAVTAAPAAGVNNRVIGYAFSDASAANDVSEVFITPGSVQG